ncbi:class I SAM-dependent methyltransferase [Mycobacterium sp. NPDC050853]|nr:methyltransferase domain-containing protein [Mycobacteroides sp. LB1]
MTTADGLRPSGSSTPAGLRASGSSAVQRRAFNDYVTRFWSLAAKAYDWGPLQQWVYSPPQDEMINQLREHGSRQIVDIACGTGILASRIADQLAPEKVYGVDMSEGMLAQAKARSGRVEWLTAPAEHLPFDDGALDAVLSTSAFHFFDQPAALAEFHRVLAPSGFAAVATLSPSQRRLPGLHNLLLNRVPANMPTPVEMRALFEGAGFDVALQRPVNRPVTPPFITVDWITVGIKR